MKYDCNQIIKITLITSHQCRSIEEPHRHLFFVVLILFVMKIILVFPLVVLLFSGFTVPQTTSGVTPCIRFTEPVVVPREVWVEKGDCYMDETIELNFSQPHANTLGVMDPDGNFFYLVFPAECTMGNLKPLVSSEGFSSLTALSICPATLKADPYIYGVLENQPVFTKSGVYRFILGDNLHVDDESALNIVSVVYKHDTHREGAQRFQN
ncbi:MAG: hypothetical protein RIQ78_195 [Bacteroidota bacterium]